MANPLYSMFNNQMPFNKGQNDMINQFNAFRSSFQGDPKQKVQELLNSGQMTQQQFNQLSSIAQMFQQIIK